MRPAGMMYRWDTFLSMCVLRFGSSPSTWPTAPSTLTCSTVSTTDLLSSSSVRRWSKVFAIYGNVLEVDEEGNVLNEGDAQYRAAQWIRRLCDPAYEVEPPFQPWETELHGP
ncbi:DUF7677 family protein [Amycolatopsis keratiniphila]|uniref:DUF7677 family protein n=1 Tax=Amycolatopsis keratiniphila TaxID=129921 RepID=UPI003F4D5442